MEGGEAQTGPSGLLTVFSETGFFFVLVWPGLVFFPEWITASSTMRLTTCYKSFCGHP